MTIAVCYNCGEFKSGALVECEKCKNTPCNTRQFSISLALSDHYFELDSLLKLSSEIRDGRNPLLDSDLHHALEAELKKSPVLDVMTSLAAISRSKTPPPLPATDPRTVKQKLAQRVVGIELSTPGIVRCRLNPFMLNHVLTSLRSVGFKKPILSNSQQFIFDCTLTYPNALEQILPSVFLSKLNVGSGFYDLWHGNGGIYAGKCGLIKIAGFRDIPNCAMVISIDPFFDQIADLLEAPRN